MKYRKLRKTKIPKGKISNKDMHAQQDWGMGAGGGVVNLIVTVWVFKKYICGQLCGE